MLEEARESIEKAGARTSFTQPSRDCYNTYKDPSSGGRGDEILDTLNAMMFFMKDVSARFKQLSARLSTSKSADLKGSHISPAIPGIGGILQLDFISVDGSRAKVKLHSIISLRPFDDELSRLMLLPRRARGRLRRFIGNASHFRSRCHDVVVGMRNKT